MRREHITLAERVLHLSNATAFRDLSRADLTALAHHATQRLFRKRDVLYDVDAPPTSLFVVVDGEVLVEERGGARFSVHAGFGVGALCLFATRPVERRATAATDVLALELPHPVVLELMEDHFAVTVGVLRTLSEGIIDMLATIGGERTFPEHPDALGRLCGCASTPLDFVQRLLFLRRLPVFEGTSMESVAAVARGLREVRIAAGEVLWRQGDPAEDFLLVVAGEVRCAPADGSWRERILPFGVSGSLTTMAHARRRSTAIAHVPTLALWCPREVVLDVMEDDFDFTSRLLTSLTDQYLDLQRRRAEGGPRERAA